MPQTPPAPIGAIAEDWPASPTRNPHAVSPMVSLLGSNCSTLSLSWLPTPPLCSRPHHLNACRLDPHFVCLLLPLPFTTRSPLLPPSPSTPAGCSACKFLNASLPPIGASPISGSLSVCCAVVSLPTRSKPCCAWAAPASLVCTPIPTITCAARSHALGKPNSDLFPRRFGPRALARPPPPVSTAPHSFRFLLPRLSVGMRYHLF